MSECPECGEQMVETEPELEDLWFGEPVKPIMRCPCCGTLEAEESE